MLHFVGFSMAFLGLLGQGFAATNTTTQQCCAMLNANSYTVLSSNAPTFEFERTDYWSTTTWLEPTCIYMPKTTEEVSEAVALFVEHGCRFAIKGGGHSTIPGAANIDNGVTMVLKQLNDTEVNVDEHWIRVGTGNVFAEVYRELDPHGQVAVVGRLKPVGFGLAVAAGVSYLSNSQGWAIDNVLSYEVVLANGTVVEANATNNADLHWALKGGNNNFGVVTHMKLATYDTKGVYGGDLTYPESSLDQLVSANYDYIVRQSVQDPLTHCIPTIGYNATSDSASAFVTLVYNDRVNSTPAIFQPWLDTPHDSNTMRLRDTYGSLVEEVRDSTGDGNVTLSKTPGLHSTASIELRTFTIYPDEDLILDFWHTYHDWMRSWSHIDGLYGFNQFWALTPRTRAEANEKGGNALGLDSAGNKPLAIILFNISFHKLEDADTVLPAFNDLVKSCIEKAKEKGKFHPYIMLTLAGWDQEVLTSYGEENVAKLKQIASAYDPDAVFQNLVPGGQKLPA
ncbi:hypothetical protein DL765_001482 [Monosporascus sp. GIB2]|nr:hypothetical protein DL765_001482 [Monosporascus sp. GIB2]